MDNAVDLSQRDLSPHSSTSTPTPTPTPTPTQAPTSISNSSSSSGSISSHSTHSTPTRTKPKAALRKYLKGFFTDRHHSNWSYTNFDSHCRSFPDSSYAWSKGKIYSFYIDELRRIRNNKSTQVPDSEITKLLNRAKHGRSQKKEKSRSKKAQGGVADSSNGTVTIVKGDMSVGTLISSAVNNKSRNESRTGHSGLTFDSAHPPSTSHVPESLGQVFQSTPPPRLQQNEEPSTPPLRPQLAEEIPVTPPAPPPIPFSDVTFSNGTSVDSWFRKLREKPPRNLRFPYLIASNILDFEDVPILPSTSPFLAELQPIISASLPTLSPCVAFALSRFPTPATKDPHIYRAITETSPREPGVDWSPENHAASYINHAVSHLLTLSHKLSHSNIDINPYLREGFFDSSVNPWFIDSLFLGGPSNLFISRKEIQSFIPGCVDKFDAVFRYVDGIQAFDLGVIEASGDSTNVNNDPKADRDYGKTLRAMAGNLEILAGLVRGRTTTGNNNWEVVRKLQVVGVINRGWNVTVLRMLYLSPKVRLLKVHRTCRIPIVVEKVPEVFPLLRLMTQCQAAMQETLNCIIPFIKKSHDDDL